MAFPDDLEKHTKFKLPSSRVSLSLGDAKVQKFDGKT